MRWHGAACGRARVSRAATWQCRAVGSAALHALQDPRRTACAPELRAIRATDRLCHRRPAHQRIRRVPHSNRRRCRWAPLARPTCACPASPARRAAAAECHRAPPSGTPRRVPKLKLRLGRLHAGRQRRSGHLDQRRVAVGPSPPHDGAAAVGRYEVPAGVPTRRYSAVLPPASSEPIRACSPSHAQRSGAAHEGHRAPLTHTHVCVGLCVCMYVCLHACMHPWMYLYMHACMHAYIIIQMYILHACTQVCARARAHTHE